MYRPFMAKNIIKSFSHGCLPGLYSVSPSGFTTMLRNFVITQNCVESKQIRYKCNFTPPYVPSQEGTSLFPSGGLVLAGTGSPTPAPSTCNITKFQTASATVSVA